MRHENSSILELDGKEVSEFTPSKPREKWLRKRTHVKIRVGFRVWGVFRESSRSGRFPLVSLPVLSFVPQNVTANHRVNDAVFTEDGAQMAMGRFMYGPLDMVTLTGEKVKRPTQAPFGQGGARNRKFSCCFLQIDIHIMTQPPSGEWVHFHTELTNSSGRISYVLPENKRLGIGVYPVKMVVR